MFTKRELNVLHSALSAWKGPYGDASLTDEEMRRAWDMLAVRDNLMERIEEILNERYVWDETSRLVMP